MGGFNALFSSFSRAYEDALLDFFCINLPFSFCSVGFFVQLIISQIQVSPPPIVIPAFDPSQDTYPSIGSGMSSVLDGFLSAYLPWLLSALAIAGIIKGIIK